MSNNEAIGGTDISVACGSSLCGAVDVARLRGRLAAAVAALGAPVARVHVRIVDDREMSALHARHMRIDEPTDVLTFPSAVAPEAIDVDVAVCIDEAARRAREFGHDVDRELLLYAVHGLLHCAGHDDHDAAAFERMHAEEDRILDAIGVGATFRPRSVGERGGAA